MAGAVYCPLSPEDPPQRLHTLLEETRSHLVLVHELTRDKVNMNYTVVDIDLVVNIDTMVNSIDLEHLSSIKVAGESIAYVLFTSGSTGTPKAVSSPHG